MWLKPLDQNYKKKFILFFFVIYKKTINKKSQEKIQIDFMNVDLSFILLYLLSI